MKEIEVLVKVTNGNTEEILNKLKEKSKYLQCSRVKDTYFYDELRSNLKPNDKMEIFECLRIREKGENYFITYKVDNFDNDGKWLYSDESETSVGNIDTIEKIISHLGLKKLVIVDMKKYFFETDRYKIFFETVSELGDFLEVESKNTDCTDIAEERKMISNFINSLNIEVTPDLGIGKPELLLKKIGYN